MKRKKVRTVFVQGGREADGIEEICKGIAEELDRRDIEVYLGAYGKLARIFAEAVTRVACFIYREEERNFCPKKAEKVECHVAVLKTLEIFQRHMVLAASWGYRLGRLVGGSDASIIFNGRKGTMAHLFPTLGLSAKQGKRVALVGWSSKKQEEIRDLFADDDLFDRVACFFDGKDPKAVVGWITGEE